MYFASTWSPHRLGSFCRHKKQGHEAAHVLPSYGTKIKNHQEIAYGEPILQFLLTFSLYSFIHKLVSIITLNIIYVCYFQWHGFRLQMRILLFPFQKLNNETIYNNTGCFFYSEKHKKATVCRQLNIFLNCIMGSGTLDCKTSSTRNNSWNKWSCRFMCSVVRSYTHSSVVPSSNSGVCGAWLWQKAGRTMKEKSHSPATCK